ncbi:MAG TPA: asparagine synthase-related protein [Gemmatimonadales bacterium]|nr:asparagine synthase-related protein [Gemmatimonadales bacterium]
MLIGATGRPAHEFDTLVAPERAMARVRGDGLAAAVLPWGVPALDRGTRAAHDAETGSWLLYSGHLLTPGARLAATDPAAMAADALRHLLAEGPRALAACEGSFALAWYDGRERRLHLARDRFGIEPLYVADLGPALLFGSRLRDLRATGLLPGGLSGQGLAEFLTWCYVPGNATLDPAVWRVPPGGRVEVDAVRGVVRRERWYRLSFAAPLPAREADLATGFRERLERAVLRQLDGAATGVLLSGGMDSSSILTFARRHQAETLHTYTFRCPGASFDESTYARALADEFGTRHHELEYGEREALVLPPEVAAAMDVPFCNVGINLGTWLLGQAARGAVGAVLTGDGGDELWGSHPVYAAQRLLARYEALPRPGVLDGALRRLADGLDDSDRKRDLRVALKRLLPAPALPAALGAWRWRAYYAPGDFAWLLTPEAAGLLRDAEPYRPVLEAFEGYDGPDDGLSPYLYNDYTTESGYYFNRLLLLRGFGVEARTPFYDRELVEFGARIPARLKLEGIERTKRLFRQAMAGVLPEVIRSRRDKLGHSVPLKNWLRGEGPLAHALAEALSPAAVAARGIFRPDAVARLLDEHRRRRHNHAHRLWAMYVLELWFRTRERREDLDAREARRPAAAPPAVAAAHR